MEFLDTTDATENCGFTCAWDTSVFTVNYYTCEFDHCQQCTVDRCTICDVGFYANIDGVCLENTKITLPDVVFASKNQDNNNLSSMIEMSTDWFIGNRNVAA